MNCLVLDKMFVDVQLISNTIWDTIRLTIELKMSKWKMVCFPNNDWSRLVARRFLFGHGVTRGLTRGKRMFSGCSSALGMASGEIKDYQLTASSTYSDSQPYQARPSKRREWRRNNLNIMRRQRGRVVRAPDLKSGGHGFESRSDHLAGVVSRSTPRSCL